MSLSSVVWTASAAREILTSAEASRPLMRAPRLSAAYSRLRLIAICTTMAASGASGWNLTLGAPV